MEHWWNETEVLEETSVPLLLFSPQIPHGMKVTKLNLLGQLDTFRNVACS
jgi:hypothetical protein